MTALTKRRPSVTLQPRRGPPRPADPLAATVRARRRIAPTTRRPPII